MIYTSFSLLTKVTGLALFCCFLLVSCTVEEKQNKDSVFYDTEGFIKDQIARLEKINPQVNRSNQLMDQQEELTLSDVNWENELDLFLTSDINIPSFLPSYTISKPDSLTTEYVLKEGESLPVRRMIVQLNPANSLPAYMEVQLYRKNKLFEMEKNLQLHASETNGQWLIKDYNISGFQEVIFLGRTTFDIKGIIQY